jgi:hypothetical protein
MEEFAAGLDARSLNYANTCTLLYSHDSNETYFDS